MIDIVDRLRATSGGVVADTQILNAAIEAADEIERLRNTIAQCELLSEQLRSLATELDMQITSSAALRELSRLGQEYDAAPTPTEKD